MHGRDMRPEHTMRIGLRGHLVVRMHSVSTRRRSSRALLFRRSTVGIPGLEQDVFWRGPVDAFLRQSGSQRDTARSPAGPGLGGRGPDDCSHAALPRLPRPRRRRSFGLREASSPVATEAVPRIGGLCKIKATIRGRLPDDRLRVRQQTSRPPVEVLQAWPGLQPSRLPGRSRAAEAIRYALGRGRR